MLISAFAGFGFGLSLIVAIGAQNAFVLRQGLVRAHVPHTVVVCALSDVVLIAAGVAGVGTLLHHAPAMMVAIRWAGFAFLAGYALLAARRALRPTALVDAAESTVRSAGAVIATCLALTWLNPHVYLDTVVLLGSVATAQGAGRWWFGVGAMLASLSWFAALGFGARYLRPLFASPRAWQVLDAAIAVVMGVLAVRLVMG
nr:LysE/ArgO family amino acid transporter [Gordonia asplenii]